jgi:hypothetical protein
MSNKKQTAVEYLIKEFSEILGDIKTEPMQDLLIVDAINKAKEMEKEQMKSIYNPTIMQNEDSKLYAKSFEQYYKETYTDKP